MSKLPSALQNIVRAEFEDTCKRRFFFGPGFEPYGGTAGLYDMGPPLCALKANLLAFWRQHFILEEGMCEVDTTCATPYEVFKASGHVERFCDVMAKDTVTGECIRVDKHIEEWCDSQAATVKEATRLAEIEKLRMLVEAMSEDELDGVLKENKILSPKGNPLSKPFNFNLMFKAPVGAEGGKEVFFRPELAQGIILNFKRLLDSNNASRLPFAGAAIGQAFRNEIAPRCNLLRVREFTLAEIEHFVHPDHKEHAKFSTVKNLPIWAFSKKAQEEQSEPQLMEIGAAVAAGLIDNETLGYFIGRTQMFLNAVGIQHVRWRQHLKLAHYAQDCWDAEALTTYGWYEIVGVADRSAYDLTCHMRESKKDLTAREEFSEPRMVEVLERKVDKKVAGKKFGKDTAVLLDFVQSMSEDEALALDSRLNEGPVAVDHQGSKLELSRDVVTFAKKTEKQTGRNYTPSVIEPSFGIGRIVYCILEQNYWVRKDESGKNDKRAVFSFNPLIAPQKVAILPLMVKPELDEVMQKLKTELIRAGISNRSDDSGAAIGKKYARVDELGIPFCITCDFVGDNRVTLRERDSAKQVRVPVNEVVNVIAQLCNPVMPRPWSDVEASFPAQE